MPYNKPTFDTVNRRIKSDLELSLNNGSPTLRRSVITILSRAIAGVVYMLYFFIEWVAKQILPDQASDEFLARWAAIFNIFRVQAVESVGFGVFTGAEDVVIPAGTKFVRADGTVYVTDSSVAIDSGEAIIPATCEIVGSIGNCDEGTPFTLQSPIAGIDSEVTAGTDGFSAGADIESQEAFRARLISRIQEPPHGGTKADYAQWCKEVPGVTRVWPYPNVPFPGYVKIHIVNDSNPTSILPDAGLIAAVQEYVDSKKPVTAHVDVYGPTALEVDYSIHLIGEDTPEIRAAIVQNLKNLHQTEGEPGKKLLLTHIQAAISNSAGEYDYSLASPSANVEPTTNQIPILGEVSFT